VVERKWRPNIKNGRGLGEHSFSKAVIYRKGTVARVRIVGRNSPKNRSGEQERKPAGADGEIAHTAPMGRKMGSGKQKESDGPESLFGAKTDIAH